MGTSHLKHHQNFAGPVKGALRAVEQNLKLLVEEGPDAFAEALARPALPRHELTARLVQAIADQVRGYALEA